MFTSRRENWSDTDIIAIVELDMKKMRVRIVWAREAITERMRELEHPRDHHGGRGESSTRRGSEQSSQ